MLKKIKTAIKKLFITDPKFKTRKKTGSKKLHVIAVAFQKHGQLKVFVQSWINQSEKNWILTVIHDGNDEQFMEIMRSYKQTNPDKINYYCTEKRFNDYGHSLREIGLKDACGDYVLLTNADNYYVPKSLEFINDELNIIRPTDPDVVLFNMVHSHNHPGSTKLPAYSYFDTSFKINHLDMGAAIVKTNLAKKVGFSDKSYAADAVYFESIDQSMRLKGEKLSIVKIPRVLLVHN